MAYFSKPGHTRAYIEAQLRWRMTEETYQIHVLGQFDCVAIVLDTADVDRSRLKQPVQEIQVDLQVGECVGSLTSMHCVMVCMSAVYVAQLHVWTAKHTAYFYCMTFSSIPNLCYCMFMNKC